MDEGPVIHIWPPACGWSVDRIRKRCLFGVTKYLPSGGGL
jgi:hypothetical protein